MTSIQIASFLLIGIAAGIASGFFGIGGGLIIVPLLVFAMGFTQSAANGTSLSTFLLPIGLLGVLAYYRAGKIEAFHIRSGMLIALGLFAGSYFGARIAVSLPDAVLRKAFATLLAVSAIRLFIR